MQQAVIQTSMGEKGKWMPPLPRLELNGMQILPLVNDAWEPVKDRWVLPGRAVLSTDEVRALAADRGWSVSLNS